MYGIIQSLKNFQNRGMAAKSKLAKDIFSPFTTFFATHGLSGIWAIFLAAVLMYIVGILFETNRFFTRKKLTLKERWKLYWKGFNFWKSELILWALIISPFLFIFFRDKAFIPLVIEISLFTTHFFSSTEKFIDKKKKGAWRKFQIRWKEYWKDFDFVNGGLLLVVIGLFIFAIIDQLAPLLFGVTRIFEIK